MRDRFKRTSNPRDLFGASNTCCRSSGRRFSSRSPSSFGFGRRLLRCPCMSAPPAKCWVAERERTQSITILPPTVRMWHLKEDGRGIRWNDSSNAKQQRIRFAFQDWGYDQHGSWSGCSNYIWTRAERFTDWADEFLIGPSRWGCPPWCYCRSVATAKHYETMGSNVPAMQWTVHSSLRMASGRHLKSLRRTSSGQQSTPLRRPVVLFAKLSKIWGS